MEPLVRIGDAVNLAPNYFRVTSVSKGGIESVYSNEVEHFVKFVEPGENMVLKGGFSGGGKWWNPEVDGDAAASWLFADESAHTAISSGGLYPSDIELTQERMLILQGKKYALEFMAWAEFPRNLQADITGEDGSNYSGLSPILITPQPKPYHFEFTMSDFTDDEARLVFSVGGSNANVYLDQISLVQLSESALAVQ